LILIPEAFGMEATAVDKLAIPGVRFKMTIVLPDAIKIEIIQGKS